VKYLIVKTSSIGDIIQTFPVVEYLKNQDPSATIDWVVEEEYASLLRSHPDISHVLPMATRRWRRRLLGKKITQELKEVITSLRKETYDVVFDLQGNTKSALATSLVRAKKKVGFGWASVPEWPNYFATRIHFGVPQGIPIQQRYLSIIQQFFADPTSFEPKGARLCLSPEDEKELARLKIEGSKHVMVAFASKWNNKGLSFEVWLEFLKMVEAKEQCIFYFVSGTAQEKEIAGRLSKHFPKSCSLQPLSFPLWQRLMGEMDLVIAVDSAALALCGTTTTASFSFFGPTQAAVYKPIGAHHHHHQGQCPYHVPFSARCPKLRTCPTGACLKGTCPSTLFKSYQEALRK
jgi:heptosyltransferase I